MDIIQLLRQSAEKGHGRALTAGQIEYLLGAMGRMAFDRQQALAAAEGADLVVSAYIYKFGELDIDEINSILKELDEEVEAEIVEDAKQETSTPGLSGEDDGMDPSKEE